MKLELKKKN